ncbi:hypothetical protein EVJ58_g5190 [Rhodofomes roseus]|uniref:Uncharacterized protein n=1 Tax=Rhodofomes roseus TaxID=34475 RepID=A0A4Y9YCU5_9APHY|nr:hypothetical protein EVJ58_g5190 [Rhodofomes roseus]
MPTTSSRTTPNIWTPTESAFPFLPEAGSVAPLVVDWGILSTLVNRPYDCFSLVAKLPHNQVTLKCKTGDFRAISHFLETYRELAVRQSLLEDQIRVFTKYRDDALEKCCNALEYLDVCSLVVSKLREVRQAAVGTKYPEGATFPTSLVKRPLDTLSLDVLRTITMTTACFLCTTDNVLHISHDLVDCDKYVCPSCATPHPGHIYSACPARSRRHADPEYKDLLGVVRALSPSSDHLALLSSVAEICDAVAAATTFRPEGRTGNPIFVDETPIPSWPEYHVVRGGRIDGVYKDPKEARHMVVSRPAGRIYSVPNYQTALDQLDGVTRFRNCVLEGARSPHLALPELMTEARTFVESYYRGVKRAFKFYEDVRGTRVLLLPTAHSPGSPPSTPVVRRRASPTGPRSLPPSQRASPEQRRARREAIADALSSSPTALTPSQVSPTTTLASPGPLNRALIEAMERSVSGTPAPPYSTLPSTPCTSILAAFPRAQQAQDAFRFGTIDLDNNVGETNGYNEPDPEA